LIIRGFVKAPKCGLDLKFLLKTEFPVCGKKSVANNDDLRNPRKGTLVSETGKATAESGHE